MRKRLVVGVALTLLAALFSPMNSASANITATGTNPSVCNQVVGVTTGVTAYRLAGGDCVIEFRNVGSTTWNRPAGVTSVRVLVVGGGGGGASRHAGGGGGGGVVEATSYAISGTVGIVVGGGGTGAATQGRGTSGSDSRFFANGEASTGATGLIAKGGGFGDFYTTSTSNSIGRAGDGGSGGGSGVPNPFTRDISTPYGNTDPRGYGNQTLQGQRTFNGATLSANFNQYGNNGAGGGNESYWSGGGGGGAGSAGSRGGGAAGTSYVGGAGGAGIASSITDTSLLFGGGGGGGGGTNTTSNFAGGAGGSGGGGAGSAGTATASSGTANTGGGGGGGGLRTDGQNGAGGAGGSGIVIVRYTPDTTAPSFLNSSTFSFAENSATSSNAATITVSESVTITFNSGLDSALFSIVISDTNTALIRFVTSPNFEAPSDVGANNVYDLSIRAADATGNFTNQSITITVTDVNEAPVITTHSSNPTHAITQNENISSIATFAATDVDTNTTLTWSVSGGDSSDFVINSSSGVLAFSSSPDFEAPLDSDTNNIYFLTVAVSDGSLSDTQTLTITISNVNESGQVTMPSVAGNPTKGIAITITVNVNTAGKVRFFVNGKRITSCLSRPTVGNYPNHSATCSWKPAVTGRHFLTATLTPTDNTFSTSTSERSELWVLKRATRR